LRGYRIYGASTTIQEVSYGWPESVWLHENLSTGDGEWDYFNWLGTGILINTLVLASLLVMVTDVCELFIRRGSK